MSIYILILFALVGFAFLAFARKWHDYAMLFTIAIGCAVNANIHNSVSAPVVLGPFTFAIDSILYSMFMFTVIICARDYDARRAKILTSSAIAAILVSAVIEFFAGWSSVGYSDELLITFIGYFSSAFGTFVGVWVMLAVFTKLNGKINVNLTFVICVLIASLLNSAIYYFGVIAVSGQIENFVFILLGSAIGKAFCVILGLLAYYINTHFWIPNNLKDRYPENSKNVSNDLKEHKTKRNKSND